MSGWWKPISWVMETNKLAPISCQCLGYNGVGKDSEVTSGLIRRVPWLITDVCHWHGDGEWQRFFIKKKNWQEGRGFKQNTHANHRSVTSLANLSSLWPWVGFDSPPIFWTAPARHPWPWTEKELVAQMRVGYRCHCDSRDSVLPPLTHRQAW